MNAAAAFHESSGGGTLDQFLEQVALVSDPDTIRDDEGVVRLMTIHGSKGLEAPVVFIADAATTPRNRDAWSAPELAYTRAIARGDMLISPHGDSTEWATKPPLITTPLARIESLIPPAPYSATATTLAGGAVISWV